MNVEYAVLQQLIDLLSAQTRAHICIHDFSGLLKPESLKLDYMHQIHAQPICSIAKSTPRGYRTCMRCKMAANRKAVTGQVIFGGYCAYGLFEIARPIIIDGLPRGIIYIGNLVLDQDETVRRIRRMCKLTEVPAEQMLALLGKAQETASPEFYHQMAYVIDSYIRLLQKSVKPATMNDSGRHWAVQALQKYVDVNFFRNVSLQSLARLYFMNDKYLGRLFRKQQGQTFHEYLNAVRIKRAEELLMLPAKSIISIALDCGFQNVTYFNRIFARQHRMSPSQYRKKSAGKPT